MNSKVGCPDDDDNENHCEHDGTDDDYEVEDFFLQGRQSIFGLVGHLGDTTEDGLVTSRNNNTQSSTRYTMSALETNATCLEVVRVCIFNCPRKWQGLA